MPEIEIQESVKKSLQKLYDKTLIYQEENSLRSFPFEHYYKLFYYVEKYNLKNGLEIGTALGLTALSSVLGNKDFKLDTVEKHLSSIKIAQKNILDFEEISNDNKMDIFCRINFINGRMFDVLDIIDAEAAAEGGGKYTDIQKSVKKYDYIFLDAYVSRLNEVKRLDNYLHSGGLFIVSNIRGEMKKSHMAKQYICDSGNFKVLEIVGDTIFAKKK
jgi:predicted O-methyltransferase YrrM